MSIRIGVLEDAISAWADAVAFHVRPEGPWDLADRSGWPASVMATSKGIQLALEVESLLERGLAEAAEGAIQVPWGNWDELVKLGLELPRYWMPWSPYLLQIDSSSSLGQEDFEYRYRFLLGSREVLLHREGAIVQRAHHPGFHMLDPQSLALVNAMDGFNALPPAERKGSDAWLRFGEVKGCAQAIGAQLDEYLVANDVVVPSKIGLTVVEKADGTISFLPRCEGLPKEALERSFLRSRDDQGLFHLDGEDGKRVRVVMGQPQQEALKRMRKVRNLRGEAAERLRRQPDQAFEGLIDRIEVAYARRVEGIGDWKPLPLPKGPSGVSMLEVEGLELGDEWDAEAEAEAMGYETFKVPVTVETQDVVTGESVQVRLDNQPDARALLTAMKEAEQAGASTFAFRGHTFAVDAGLKESLRQGSEEEGAKPSRKFLLIYTDEEHVEAEDVVQAEAASQESLEECVAAYEPPKSLDLRFPLKPHQEEAVAWLQRCARLVPQRRGVLLADEMGLGKTLEVLAFTAWCIEKNVFPGLHGETGPFRPILIVAPLMLVENETWQNDVQKFFAPGTFGPILSLHGAALQSLRLARGKETDLGKPLLDLEFLQKHKIVITNYETVTNFQHSFAQVRDGRSIWSIVVTDEAQEFKNPQARISHAIKALHPDFHIASTGTPVENRLLDIWNLFDALQPSLLGSAREFKQRFEVPVDAGDSKVPLDGLRETLCYQRPHAFLLRREKTILPGFPKKTEVPISCAMSEGEVDRHVRLLRALKRADSKRGLHLSYLHRLVELYQHPLAHRDDFESLPVAQLVQSSPKLEGVLDRLKTIQEKGEKALIFARHIKIQRMLARVIGETFGLQISIINGETGRVGERESGAQNRGRHHRAQILQRFKNQPGFHALVLSPFVAGVGLTITEANHVIHFGRWWNPAVESQATDRVYRIGQEKDVLVHLPLLKDDSGRLPASFDERLHELLDRKRALARDFLSPMEDEKSLASELYRGLSGDLPAGEAPQTVLMGLEDLKALPSELFEAYVASILEQDGYLVKLADPKHSGGLSMMAQNDRQRALVKISHHIRPEMIEQDLTFLETLQWGSQRAHKILIARHAPEGWCPKSEFKPGFEVWKLADLWARQRHALDEMDLIPRSESRVLLTAVV